MTGRRPSVTSMTSHYAPSSSADATGVGSALRQGMELVNFRFHSGKKPPKGMLKRSPITYTDNYSGVFSLVAGEQAVNPIMQYPNLFELIGPSNNLAPGPIGCPMNPFDMIPHYSVSNTTIMTGVPEASFERCYLKSIQCGVTIWNATNVGAEVDVYFMECRQNIQRVIVAPGTNPTTFNEMLPYDIWQQGLKMEGPLAADETYTSTIGTFGNTTYNQLGTSPFSCKFFRKFYKLLKVKKCVLAANAQCKLNCTYTSNKLLDYERLSGLQQFATETYAQQRVGVNNQCRMGLLAGGLVVMLVARGQLTRSNAGSTIQTASNEIGWMIERRLKFGLMASNNKLFVGSVSQPGGPANIAVANQFTVSATDASAQIVTA